MDWLGGRKNTRMNPPYGSDFRWKTENAGDWWLVCSHIAAQWQ